MWQLKSLTDNPPGNFYYEQTSGIRHTFKPQPVIEELAKSVSAFRIANNLQRASLAESLQDVDHYTCSRLRNDERWCWECPHNYAASHAAHRFIAPPCGSCGSPAK